MNQNSWRWARIIFLLISALVVGAFLYVSNSIVKDLARQERSRMQIWAAATKEIVSAVESDATDTNIDFLLSIIEDNNNIPVLLTDNDDNILQQRNFRLPDTNAQWPMESERNRTFLQEKLTALKQSGNRIDIEITPTLTQHLYYEDSTLLRRLSLFPYIQLAVMAAFIFVVYYAVTSSKRAEQNKVWVGLSKETAHQLGTPISSLMAWTEIMRDDPTINPDMVQEITKDVDRLSTIASRFSKIGSQPSIGPTSVNEVVSHAASYMRSRISRNIHLVDHPAPLSPYVKLSVPLMEWVLENLIKNAVDAMPSASGTITISIDQTPTLAIINVADTGKGMTRKMRRDVFRPGFTTKKRGWGLGLTLARRIVEQYHNGRIFVSQSEPGVGTTFTIQLPLCQSK